MSVPLERLTPTLTIVLSRAAWQEGPLAQIVSMFKALVDQPQWYIVSLWVERGLFLNIRGELNGSQFDMALPTTIIPTILVPVIRTPVNIVVRCKNKTLLVECDVKLFFAGVDLLVAIPHPLNIVIYPYWGTAYGPSLVSRTDVHILKERQCS